MISSDMTSSDMTPAPMKLDGTVLGFDVGARRMRLSTTPFLHDAIRLYERAGFERRPALLDLHGTPLFAMIKELTGSLGA